MVFWLGLILLIAIIGFIRLSPNDPARWHNPPQVSENKDFKAGAKRLVSSGPDGLARFDEIALATPRTSVLAGSVESGMVTYITRSAVFGFPDFTTVQQDGDSLQIYARLRFGASDTGVNRARIGKWIDALGL